MIPLPFVVKVFVSDLIVNLEFIFVKPEFNVYFEPFKETQ